MESTVAHQAWWMQAYAWADARKTQLAYAGVALLVAALAVSYLLYHRAQRKVAAAEALSRVSTLALTAGENGENPESYLKVAEDYGGTSAAGQALLRAGTAYFADGKYAEAQTQYERFVRDHRESPLIGQALFGVAACLDAQGKTAEAADRYRNLIDRRPNDSVIPRAKLNLGRICESQDKPEQARPLYEEVARSSPYGVAGAEARLRFEALLANHPELAEVKVPATNAPAITVGAP